MKTLFLFTLILQFAYLIFAKSNSLNGDRILVILDKLEEKKNYSIFFKSLEDRGFDLTYSSASDENLEIIKYEESLYDHLILLAPETQYYENEVNTKQFIEFIDKGGNILLTANEKTGTPIKDLLYEFGATVDEENFEVIDNFAHNGTTPNVLAIKELDYPISLDKLEAPVLYSGTAIKSNGKNPYVKPVLVAGPAAYSWDDSVVSMAPLATGKNIILVHTLQAINNSRIVMTGSSKMFTDKYIESPVKINDKTYDKSGNLDFITNISKWTFQEKKVLKVISSKHHRINESERPEYYTIKNEIHYEIEISEYNDGQWQPFNATDVQLELIMLDPYIRTTLKQMPITNPNSSTFAVDLMIPDHCGVFTFKVDYRRYGLSWLLESDVIAIHPLHYNEFPRFLVQGLPYYFGAFSMLGGFILVTILALYHEDKKEVTPKKKTN
ncbi:Dolichyl-diphosphooligosaccharide-protein glycosyltransferase 48kDa subunit [Neocallimastix lanati (nom. inval.)]|jgi:oligosaccharyltransferase complex subunit beta|uniref:Dolichyl-diphosphooligosaccharide--protein glycosyltransferase subunit WBP1 n=1 Tax=Neocallimastix californiae TaxID=1754190 RepID=A0A1Y2AD78_9FUNG|nr:Dolichyl-diphosphooligosaccharide-protein glycosyltransferase 48kDa subunit [Neocallimastix sp. JGI-2020a]ORY20519.1 Dolichyl-diphosphooligosaccharide-protein glycosyltransferase 48kDa subunit [Neocallimastix californiae]|eukprot:ORY20519.1 Dolichyl-diphosphooligosaccharide-protein glycosyltransferase 48kDa subunit [Neocallimastix californiae]